MAIDESDMAVRRLEDIDTQWLGFLRHQVNSFVKWDLVRFFYENRDTPETADNIARYADSETTAIEKELIELADSGVLQRETEGETTFYTLSTDQEMRDLVEEFVLACNDRQFKLKAIYHIIRGIG